MDKLLKPNDFTNHSGGCPGSDLEWDKIGRALGFTNHIHWRPEDLKTLGEDGRKEMLDAFIRAADALKRPKIFKGIEYCQRDWFQAKKGKGIYAISFILEPGEKDLQGRKNNSGKQTVAGGTGWAVEMGIQMEKPVFVFDMKKDKWFYWENEFIALPEDRCPTLTQEYAGIGTRNPTPAGKKAIVNVYKRTLDKISVLAFENKLKQQT